MQRGKEHIAAIVENRLRAIAVMIIDIEDRHALHAPIAQILRRDRRIVQIAEPRHRPRPGMVPRRPAQRERSLRPIDHRPRPGQRDIGAGAHRRPCPRRDRHRGIDRIKPQLAVDMARRFVTPHHARRPGIRQRIPRFAQRAPFVPRGFQECDIIVGMHPRQRAAIEMLGRQNRPQPGRTHRIEDMIGARRHFETGHKLAAIQFGRPVMQPMVIAIDCQHRASPTVRGRACPWRRGNSSLPLQKGRRAYR